MSNSTAKKKRAKGKVMVFGVFDLLHPGHLNFFKQAKRLGDFLIVSIARDVNVLKEKGRSPVFDERHRRTAIEALKYVDKVVLGGLQDPWKHIIREKPDVVALGYDQHAYLSDNEISRLEQELKRNGVNARVVRLRPYHPDLYKSSKIRERAKQK